MQVFMTDEQIIAIASKRNSSLEIGLPVLQLDDLSQAIQTLFPEGNFTFCIRDADESFVNDYLDALFASAKRMIQDSGIHAIHEAKVYWVNQYDSDANPDCLNGHFKMTILAPKPNK